MKKNFKWIAGFCIVASLFYGSCGKDDPVTCNWIKAALKTSFQKNGE